MVSSEIDPAVADQTVIYPNLRLSACVIDFIELRGAVVPRIDPRVNGIETGLRDVRRIRSGRGFGAAVDIGKAIADRVRDRAVIFIVSACAGRGIYPRSGVRHTRHVVVEHDLIELPSNRAHRYNGGPSAEQVVDVVRKLFLVAEIFDDFIVVRTVSRPTVE